MDHVRLGRQGVWRRHTVALLAVALTWTGRPVVVHAQTCASQPPGLVSWWRGEGDAADTVGANSGTLQGGTFFTAAEVNQGFTFDSDDDRVVIPHNTNLNVGGSGFTAEFWMKGIKNQPQSTFVVFEKSHGGGTGWAFQGDGSTGLLFFVVGDGSGFPGASTNTDVLDGSFHHIAGTWDGSTLRLYLDGVLQQSAPLTTPAGNTRDVNIGFWWGFGSPQRIFRGTADDLAIYNRALSPSEIQAIVSAGAAGKCFAQCVGASTNGAVEFGEQCDDGNATNGDGCTDLCRIETCHACTGSPSSCSPLGGTPCDDGLFCNGADTCDSGACTVHPGDPCAGGPDCFITCNEATDSCLSPAATPCTDDGLACTDDVCNGAGLCTHPPNGPCPCLPPPADLVSWWRAEGNANDTAGINHGTLFAGASTVPAMVGQGFSFPGYVLVNYSPTLDMTAPGFTAEFWMRGIHNQTEGLFTVFDKSHGGGDSAGWTFQGVSSSGQMDFLVGQGGGGNTNFINVGSALDLLDGTFHHVAGTWDGATIRFYIDGILQSSAALPLAPANNTRRLNMGTWQTVGRQFTGLLDEATLYHRALTPTEIADLYAVGSAGKCAPLCGNGILDLGEQCDDSNTMSGDCCSASCQYEAPASPCATDGNPCTNDQCNGAGACLHPNNTAPCDDGVFCNGADSCSGGACTQHAGNPCTGGPECANSCNEAADNCFVTGGTACTSDGNVCTLDQCNGAGACAHPAGNPGTECRAAAGQCDVAETCTGASPACPGNLFQSNGTPCNDGNACTMSDTCQSGVCGGTGATCDPCEVCDTNLGCVVRTGPCSTTVSKLTALQVRATPGDPSRNSLSWKWTSGYTEPSNVFGDPTQPGHGFTLCLIDNRGGHPTLLASATAPGGSMCGSFPCWKGTSYKSKQLTPDGLAKVALKASGKSSIKVKGKGALLGLPSLGLTTPVSIRLTRDDEPAAYCWGATYSTPTANTATVFQSKGD